MLNIKWAVNSVFTHGSFHWIKARGCCVSLDSHHYALWILMSAAHWGAMLKRTRLAPGFRYCVSSEYHPDHLPASRSTQAYTHTNTHEEILIKTYSACTEVYTHIFLSHWMIKVHEARMQSFKCYLRTHSGSGGGVRGGDPGRLLFKVMVNLSNMKPSHCALQYQLWVGTQ